MSAILVIACAGLPNSARAQGMRNTPVTSRSPHGSFSLPCQNCHTSSAWRPIRSVPEFDHDTTRFALKGMHLNVSCTECHTSPVFSNVGQKCSDCHADIHRRQMGAECEKCHTVQGWSSSIKSVRDHQNRFPLLGAHAMVECDTCHKNLAAGQFQGLPIDCVGCHMNDLTNAKSPDHVSLGFETICQDCHRTMDTWHRARYDHNLVGFPLLGAHASLDCASCHAGGQYTGTSATCINCHRSDYNSAKNPDHVASGFSLTCQQCHSSTTWLGATAQNAAKRALSVSRAKSTPSLAVQHQITSAACVTCHQKDFTSTKNPNHIAAGFPTDCSICHSSSTWTGARFDHSKSGFALTGAHSSQTCSNCHSKGQYAGLSTLCSSCHLSNFNKTTNPKHIAAGFPQDCAICHTTSSWTPANFNHTKTAFPLSGAHTSVLCANCHVGGKYAGTPTACYSCHKSDYTSVANPGHIAAGIPTTCATCHNTTTWAGATLNHTSFPVYSGVHQGKWTTCGDCHTNPSNYAAFTCVTCHSHEKTTMDQKHTSVRSYVYNSSNCYSCHMTGRVN